MALGMVIIYGKLIYWHVVSEGNMDKEISTMEYNNRTFYDYLNNTFTDDFGSPSLNLPPITTDDRPHLHKRYHFTPDLLPAAISVASENYFSTLTALSDLPDLLPSDDHNTLHVMKKYEPYHGRLKIGY